MRSFALVIAAFALCSCSTGPKVSSSLEGLETRELTMPNGKTIRVEAMINPVDLQRGLMYRESLPAGRGALFIHRQASPYQYWMYQVKIPLDMIFIDAKHRVLGIAANVPPCRTKASECPQYGGYPGTQFVLELGGGEARKYGIEIGQFIAF